MAPFYKISVHEKTKENFLLKISIDQKITLKWHVMWYYNSQPSFKIEVQLVSIIRIWFFSSGGVTKIHQIYNFWLNKLKDFIL
jgi:hypothetical protein